MAKRLAFMSAFAACAIILCYVESLIPINFGIPGVKIGLPNLIIILALYYLGTKEALLINIVRIIVVGMLFGNLFGILFSISGGLVSFVFMYLCKKVRLFNIITVSVVGGVMHNVGQIIVAAFIVHTYGILYYVPVLIISGIITGFAIGIVSSIIRNKIKADRWIEK